MTDDDKITPQELCEQLGVDLKRLRALVKEGLPFQSGGKRKTFDPKTCWFGEDEAADWLTENGYLSKPRIVISQADVAAHFGISPQRVSQWVRQGCPGSEGFYDLDQIEAWRAARGQKGALVEDSDRAGYETELSRIRAEKEQLQLDELRERLIDANLVRNVQGRMLAETKARLESLPEFQLSLLPTDLSETIQKRVREETLAKVVEILTRMAEFSDELAEELRERKAKKTKRL